MTSPKLHIERFKKVSWLKRKLILWLAADISYEIGKELSEERQAMLEASIEAHTYLHRVLMHLHPTGAASLVEANALPTFTMRHKKCETCGYFYHKAEKEND